ncbi:MAG TPA: zf-HC2 domain-containing protein [Terriglobia bacterium]|nr:zf-HC2 domain-containing protein [Terriglobia bacterium]
MNCKRYAKWINEAAFGALDATREAEFRRHLLECPHCQTQIEQEQRLLAAINQTMARSLAAEPAASLCVKTRQRIAEGATAKVSFWLTLRILGTVAAACVVFVAIVVLAWQVQRRSVRQHAAPTATVAREESAPQAVRHETRTVTPSGNGVRQAAVSHSSRRARSRRPGNNLSHQNTLPQVLVPKNEMALVLELYNGVRTGKIDGASLLAVPPGFKREPDGTLVPAPIEIKPIEIAQLGDDSGSLNPQKR